MIRVPSIKLQKAKKAHTIWEERRGWYVIHIPDDCQGQIGPRKGSKGRRGEVSVRENPKAKKYAVTGSTLTAKDEKRPTGGTPPAGRNGYVRRGEQGKGIKTLCGG